MSTLSIIHYLEMCVMLESECEWMSEHDIDGGGFIIGLRAAERTHYNVWHYRAVFFPWTITVTEKSFNWDASIIANDTSNGKICKHGNVFETEKYINGNLIVIVSL